MAVLHNALVNISNLSFIDLTSGLYEIVFMVYNIHEKSLYIAISEVELKKQV